MVRKLALAVSIAVGSLPMSVYALGMGGMKTHSALNERFKADIELVSVEKGTLDTLKVTLAPSEVFARVGLERSFFLTRLKFQPMRLNNGKAIIRVSSKEPIREPFLDFFVKLDWPNGQVVREYTALLDPPTVTKRSAPKVSAASSQSSGTQTKAASAPSSAKGTAQVTDGQYGPIQANETLWDIADSLASDGVSIHQMMMALYKANPDAFLHNNINLLKKGRMLQVPSVDEAAGLSQREAVAEFQQQEQGWMSNTDTANEAATDTAEAADTSSAADATEEAQLKIAGTPAEAADTDVDHAVSDLKVEQGGADLKQRMLLLEEEAETARQESVHLRSQLDDVQQQLEDSKRLLELQNEELARLRQGLGQTDTAATEESGSDVNEVAAEVSSGDETEIPAEEVAATDESTTIGETTTVDETGIAEESSPVDETSLIEEVDTTETPASEAVEETGTEVTDYLANTAEEQGTAVEEQVTEEPATEEIETVEETVSSVEEPPAAEEHETADKEASFIDKTLAAVQNNWQLAAGAGGGVLLLSLLAVAAGRRRKKSDTRATPYMDDDSVDQESILLEDESSLADTVADSMAAGSVGDTSFLSEYSTEEFKGLQEDTAEVDPVSEADVYIAYGRYQQAEEILNEAMAAGNDSASVKYKMLEVYYATQKKEAFATLANEMVQSGQYQEDPSTWEHIQTMGRDLDKSNPLFASDAAAVAGAASEAAASVTPASEEVGEDSELSLDLSTLAEEVDSVLNVDSEPLDGFSELDLDFSSLQAEETDADDSSGKQDDSLNMEDLGTSGNDDGLGETELHTELLDITELGDVNVGSTNLDDALADLSGDLEGVMADSQILDEPLDLEDDRFSTLDEDISPDSQISGLEDDLDVSAGEDSVIGDEVETKLELAKAFMEIGDADGARSILQEVEDDGTPDQKEIASQLLGQIED